MNIRKTLASLVLAGTIILGTESKTEAEQPYSFQTKNVSSYKTDGFKSIQEAIDSSSEGDTIFVRAGTYNESLSLPNHSLKIVGESWTNTILDGTGITDVRAGIYQERPNTIEIRGLTIRNFETQAGGMWLSHNGGDVEISMTAVENNSGGIFLGGQSGGTYNIHDNLIKYNHSQDSRFRGLYFWFGNGEITRNTIMNNNQGGIGTYYGPSPLIKDNIIVGNNGPGLSVSTYGQPLVTGNLISNNLQGINQSMAGLIFNDNIIIENEQEGLFIWDWAGTPANVAGSGNILSNNGTYNANHTGVTTANLRGNWWGSSPPDSSKINGPIIYDGWLNIPPKNNFSPEWVGEVGIKSIEHFYDNVTVSWNTAIDDSGDVIYDVFKRANEESYDRDHPYWSGTTTSFIDTLTDNQRHWYNVRARDIYGNSDININEMVFPEHPTIQHFIDCFNGPSQDIIGGCRDVNYDNNSNIDLKDFAKFTETFTSN